jgi:hypothetical protein
VKRKPVFKMCFFKCNLYRYAKNLYNSDAMYNPGPADFDCNAHKPFGQKIDGRPWWGGDYTS